jgi:2-polyprenyl-3-methyl-5-hydroxy-6-metoxy-1,4-benzoquinol methylase
MFSYLSPRIKWLSRYVSGKTILDVGFAGSYQQTSAHDAIQKSNPQSLIIPFDIDRQRVFKHQPKNAVVGDGFALPFKSNSIDTVVLAEILEHLEDWIGFLRESSRVVRKQGYLIITTPNPFSIFRILKHWYLSLRPDDQINIKTYLGAPDHLQFIEPLSLMNALLKMSYKPQIITTTNLSLPYFPKVLKDIELNFWPANRLGTYTCIKAQKLKE